MATENTVVARPGLLCLPWPGIFIKMVLRRILRTGVYTRVYLLRTAYFVNFFSTAKFGTLRLYRLS